MPASGVLLGKRVKAVVWFFKVSVSLKGLSSSDLGKEDLLPLQPEKKKKKSQMRVSGNDSEITSCPSPRSRPADGTPHRDYFRNSAQFRS